MALQRGSPWSPPLLSCFSIRPILDNLGMTGEITLTGRILGVGGMREKLIAARRSD